MSSELAIAANNDIYMSSIIFLIQIQGLRKNEWVDPNL